MAFSVGNLVRPLNGGALMQVSGVSGQNITCKDPATGKNVGTFHDTSLKAEATKGTGVKRKDAPCTFIDDLG